MYPCGSAQFSSLTATIQIPFPNHTVALETPAAARQSFKNSKMKRLVLWKFQRGNILRQRHNDGSKVGG